MKEEGWRVWRVGWGGEVAQVLLRLAAERAPLSTSWTGAVIPPSARNVLDFFSFILPAVWFLDV